MKSLCNFLHACKFKSLPLKISEFMPLETKAKWTNLCLGATSYKKYICLHTKYIQHGRMHTLLRGTRIHGPQDQLMTLQAPTPLLRCTLGNMAPNRRQAELPLAHVGFFPFFVFFFAESTVLNLSKLNMQFFQQINSLLKTLCKK